MTPTEIAKEQLYRRDEALALGRSPEAAQVEADNWLVDWEISERMQRVMDKARDNRRDYAMKKRGNYQSRMPHAND